jgi:hypothetical protein
MLRFYKAKTIKKPIGTAIEHILPAFKGRVITDVYDITTDGDYRLFVVDCNETDNEANLSLDGVTGLSQEDAISMAVQFQPARKIKTIDPATNEEKEVDLPELNLKPYLA